MDDKPTGVRFRTILEVLGKPKEHIETAIKEYVKKIKDDSEYIILKESYSESSPQGQLWSIYAELEIVARDVTKLIGFCFEYMPSSVEIIKPDQFALEHHIVTGFLNDLQSRLHNVDMVVKKLKAENDLLRRNLKSALENIITVLLKMNPMNIDELSIYTGINKEELQNLLEKMQTENKIKVENNNYKLAKNE